MNLKRFFSIDYWKHIFEHNSLKQIAILGILFFLRGFRIIYILNKTKHYLREKIRSNPNILKKNPLIIFLCFLLKYITPNSILLVLKRKLFLSKTFQFLIRYFLSFNLAKKNKDFYSKRWSTYKDDCKVTAIVSVFNHDYTAKHISENLKNNKFIDQIIILNDGSTDKSYEEFRKYLYDVNHFILTSNDLNTLRTYDRAVKMARSEYVIIMQDDDIFPEGNAWLSNSLELFNKIDDLGLIGGWNTLEMKSLSKLSDEDLKKFTFKTFVDKYSKECVDNEGPKFCHNFKDKFLLPYDEHPNLKESNYKTVQFAPACDIGPYIIKKNVFEDCGGIDFSWGEVGKSSCWWEIDLCYRIWKNGNSVINLPMHFHKGQSNIGSDQFYQNDSKLETLETGLIKLLKKHKEDLNKISETCNELNFSYFRKFR